MWRSCTLRVAPSDHLARAIDGAHVGTRIAYLRHRTLIGRSIVENSAWVIVSAISCFGCAAAQPGAGGSDRPMSECQENKQNVQEVAKLTPQASVQLTGRYRCVITDTESTHVETDGIVTFQSKPGGMVSGTFADGSAWSGKIMGDTYYALTNGNYPTVMLQATADGSSATGSGVNVETTDLPGMANDRCTLYSYECTRL
jgi:hypothetical protein